MSKRLNYILGSKEPASTPHPALETLAALADGRIDEQRRAQCIHHVNRCPRCYNIVDNTLHDVAEIKQQRVWSRLRENMRSIQAIAASLLLAVFLGGGLFWHLRSPVPAVLVASLELNSELKNILSENERLSWSDEGRIKRLKEQLYQNGIQIARLDKVIMDAPYFSGKSFFGPKEIMKIELKEGVAYLSVREEPRQNLFE